MGRRRLRTEPPVEVALAVKGTLDDPHHGDAWQRIAADGVLVQQYNAMKLEFVSRSIGEYNAAKREFFYSNFRL
jgi:hypothetical protein